ncbi:MAG: GNAT family N-acetyltransferase [Rufibacter sp.]
MRQTGIPYPATIELSTARLWLRAYSPEMALPFWKLIQENRERLLVDFPDRTAAVQTLEDAAHRIRIMGYQRKAGDLYSLGIFRKDNEEYIGDITLRRLARGKLYSEVGYYLSAEAEGQGFATEALRAVVKYAFQVLRMEYVNLRCATENQKSQGVAQRCGFRHTKTYVPVVTNPGEEPRELNCYRLQRDDFATKLLWRLF